MFRRSKYTMPRRRTKKKKIEYPPLYTFQDMRRLQYGYKRLYPGDDASYHGYTVSFRTGGYRTQTVFTLTKSELDADVGCTVHVFIRRRRMAAMINNMNKAGVQKITVRVTAKREDWDDDDDDDDDNNERYDWEDNDESFFPLHADGFELNVIKHDEEEKWYEEEGEEEQEAEDDEEVKWYEEEGEEEEEAEDDEEVKWYEEEGEEEKEAEDDEEENWYEEEGEEEQEAEDDEEENWYEEEGEEEQEAEDDEGENNISMEVIVGQLVPRVPEDRKTLARVEITKD